MTGESGKLRERVAPAIAVARGLAAPAALTAAGVIGWLSAPAGWLLGTVGAAGIGIDLVTRVRRDAAIRKMAGIQAHRPLSEALEILRARLDSFEHRALHRHPLTGLPTREHLFRAIEGDIADHGEAGMLATLRLVDFDRIAAFDAEEAGRALAALADRITNAARDVHVVAHVDRDCLAIWFGSGAAAADSLAEFRALLFLAAQEIETGATLLTPTIEAGTALHPADGADAGALLTRALAALARPQPAASRELTLAASPSIDEARERFAIEQDLAQAINEDQLTMLFQPVVDLSAWRVVGAEALLRWDHPTLGSISPAKFIPIVEAIGLSDRYGAWVLNNAAREVRRWKDAGADLKIAVNLSACQLADEGLKLKIERTLERHKLLPQTLELELTETAAMADAARTLQLFGELHAMGISLAIDDFGSGYSSLSYLKNLPFDKLKIDREFVRQVDRRRDSQAICRALIALAGGLRLRVLAEGVETAEEVATLRRMGCTLFQGFHFARPLPSAEFLSFVKGFGPARPVHDQIARLKGRLSA